MFSELDPTATTGRRVDFCYQTQRCGLCFKHGSLIPYQPENERALAAHGPALIHADIGGRLGGEIKQSMPPLFNEGSI
jgi:hypothetical protein